MLLPTEWAGCAHKEGLRERRGRKRKEKERRRKEKIGKEKPERKKTTRKESKTFGRRNKATRAAPARAGSRGGAPGR